MKRLAWVFVIILTLFLWLSPRLTLVVAASWRNTPFGTEYDSADNGEVNQGAYTDRVNKSDIASLVCMIIPIGPSTVGAQDGLCTNNEQTLSELYRHSAIGYLNGYISMMYANPPADLALWLRETGQDLGVVPKQVYAAQGIGFSGLAPLLPLWTAFRNIAYVLLAIVMIVVGFMVMFRKKIDPKTVVTVQNALPRIVIVLLLITFSYALVGLMIDLMYLVLFLAISILVPASGGSLGQGTASAYATGGFPTLFAAMFGGGFRSIDDIVRFLNPGLSATNQVVSVFANIVGWLGTIEVEAVLIALILALVMLFTFIRIFFMLLNAYIQIIIAVLVAPLQFLLDALPGGMGFSSWIKNLISNLMVFPITAVLILIGTILTQTTASNLWTPPLLGIPKLGISGTSGVAGLIGLGLLMVIPNIVNGIKEALKAKPALPVGLGAVTQPVTSVYGTAMGGISQLYYLSMLRDQLTKNKEPLPPGVSKPK